ncbi:hypothetical protein CUMW_066540 [Citrus unshiu]|nr:hypothetical protein CUMW_066540 [Citrus unshiu]
MLSKWKEMTEQREEDLCENCVNVLIGEPDLHQGAFCREEKKAEAENSADDKKKERNNYGFISYFKETVQKIKENNENACITKEIRKETGMAFKNLPIDKRHKYTIGRHKLFRLSGERPKFVSRCVPERLASVIGKLRAEQRAALCSIGFGQLLEMKCISDRGMHVELDGDINQVSGYVERLMDGITRYKEEKLSYVGGCLLYLQVLYINSVFYGKSRKDASMCPVVRWDAYKIRKFMKWLDKQGGIGTNKVAMRGSVMKGCKVVDQGGESYQLVAAEIICQIKDMGSRPVEIG